MVRRIVKYAQHLVTPIASFYSRTPPTRRKSHLTWIRPHLTWIRPHFFSHLLSGYLKFPLPLISFNYALANIYPDESNFTEIRN